MAYRVIATSRGDRVLGFENLGMTIAVLSLLALAGALAIEHIGGIAPCPLCLDQRIAYYAAIPVGLAAFAFSSSRPGLSRLLLAALAIGFFINAGLGVYHSGVEWGWWPGPEGCSGMGEIANTPADLLNSLSQDRVIRCDEAPVRVLGLSLAGYSAILSAILGVAAVRAVARGETA